ncbi:MAG: hypothetical protein ACPGJF_03285 [Sinimarinibacterium flocculans]|uniref:hypothetical protein n=1 Tax=Sinimarinibacterium flocculans TaxID=985250 RepID=UPI003C4BCD22
MKVTCPNCGTFGSLALFASDADARHCVQLAAKLPPAVERSLFAYLQLFAPAKRVQTWKKMRTLLGELVPAIEAQRVERHGRPWTAPHAAWIAAFDEMVDKRDKLTLPLKSNGYLFEILAGGANRVEAAAEEAREQSRRPVRSSTESEIPRAAISDAVLRTQIAAENRVRARMGKPPMSPDEEAAFLAREGRTQTQE